MTRRERRALEREQKKSRVSPRTKLSYWYRLVPCLAAFLIYARSLSFVFVTIGSRSSLTHKLNRGTSYQNF
jgi:hypothetical protein